MGSGFSSLLPCLRQGHRSRRHHQPPAQPPPSDLIYSLSEPLDETLGHSYCYVRSSNRFVSPPHSDRFVSPSGSFRFSPSHEPGPGSGTGRIRPGSSSEQLTTVFRAISGASVSANTLTPRTVLQLDSIYDDATESAFGGGHAYGSRSCVVNANGFEGTSSFRALPLQPVPRGSNGAGAADQSGPIEGSGLFMSGPIERGTISGPLDPIPGSESGGVHFSAPLGGLYLKKRRKKRKKSLSWHPNFAERKQRPWVVPVLNFVGGRKENIVGPDGSGGGGVLDEAAAAERARSDSESDLQWALGKAGEDRVQLVVSEKQGWLFAGIYDGFNGPDAPEFLMANLYRAVYSELQGLFWELDEQDEQLGDNINKDDNPTATIAVDNSKTDSSSVELEQQSKVEVEVDQTASTSSLETENEITDRDVLQGQGKAKNLASHPEVEETKVRKRLWELLAEAEAEDGLDLSGSDRFAFSVDDALRASAAGSVGSKRWMLLSKLKQGLSKHKEGVSGRKLFPWRFGLEEKEVEEVDHRVEEHSAKQKKRRKAGPIDHELVLRAMSNALEATEQAFLEMTDKVLDTNPELALMGSCLLVVLMRDEDVYVMNLGDSRALIAQYHVKEEGSSVEIGGQEEERRDDLNKEDDSKEPSVADEKDSAVVDETPPQTLKLTALQLSTDHSTSIEDEVTRIKNEHPDDSQCILNDRVKGRLKVTRAFGAGFLKQPKLNDALLEMFRNDFIGTTPYISCLPSLRHYHLSESDQFLVLSSDGLYQYLTNEEVVSLAMEKFPDGDPAQHVIQELLVRAAKKAGLAFHDLLDIPQGDRRKYHDDCTVLVISLEGRIWKSSGKYL
ncbi:PREDICTED: protein phosphatase 2C 29 [Tarenaya hassleriana]|uniref:protein phosphatase 2C 29 n=1 Tax=Tarenaya hassleriana TaxID=28532 RepID=UPI00053C32E4|nr:PREDICTED: protein phosphatase 2C 29 [Tarenaya hassleriana]